MESLGNIGLVLGLAGLTVIVLYLIFRQILNLEIFPRLNAIVTEEIIKNIIDRVFHLALVAMILGFLGFALINILPLLGRIFRGPVEETEPRITYLEPFPEEVTSGDRVVISWNVANADEAGKMELEVNPSSGIAETYPVLDPSSSHIDYPEVTTRYLLRVYQDGTSESESTQVKVRQPVPGAPIIERFALHPDTIAPGEVDFIRLYWKTDDYGNEVAIEPHVSKLRQLPGIGSEQIEAPLVTTVYTLTAVNASSSASALARVIVNTPTPVPETIDDATNAPDPALASPAADTPGAEDAETQVAATRTISDVGKRATLIEGHGVDPFLIDRSEVTNEQYGTCVAANVCDPPKNDRWHDDQFTNYPVTDVNLKQATVYCSWLDGNLPTVEQWTAAISPEGTRYPWGNDDPEWGDQDPSCELTILRYCYGPKVSRAFPVGSRPAGNSPPGVRIENGGIADLIGNVWEWTNTEPQGRPDLRLVAGGSWSNPAGKPPDESEILTFTYPNQPFQGIGRQTDNLGFRCTWPPDAVD